MDTNSTLVDNIQQVINRNQSELLDVLEFGTGNSGEVKTVTETVSGGYNNIEYTVSLSFIYRDEEPHRYQIEDGRYKVEITCNMSDTSILLDLREDLTEFGDNKISKEVTVTQDYPTRKIRISHDLTEDEFRESFVQ